MHSLLANVGKVCLYANLGLVCGRFQTAVISSKRSSLSEKKHQTAERKRIPSPTP